MRAISALLVTTVMVVLPDVARAGDKELCATSYADGQRSQRHGALLQARAALETCLRECSEVAQPDCATWLAQVERVVPSIVVSVERGGVDVANATVLVDGAPIADGARAVALDPGPHRVEADVEGAHVAVDVVLREGEKERRVVVALEAKPIVERRPVTTMGWVTIGSGALGFVGLATFAAVGSYGNARFADLERCRPRCNPDEVASVRTSYAVADVALGVGIVAVGVAVVSYLLGRSNAAGAPTTVAGGAR